jgi:dienelactone hydrolase
MHTDRRSSLRWVVSLAAVWCLTGIIAVPLRAQAPPSSARPSGAGGTTPEAFDMRSVTIWSNGTRMAGDLYLPRDRAAGEKLPGVVFCAGTGGTKKGTGRRLGPLFAAAGYAALAFDYRGWGESDSQLMSVDPQPAPPETGTLTLTVRPLRWQMNYADQTEDIRAAISFLAGEPGVDRERIGIMGSSYGGGLVTWIAGHDPRVRCVVAQVPGLGGARSAAAEQRMYDLHTAQARGETEPVPVETGKLGGKMARYDQMRANPAKSIGYSAVEAAGRITAPSLFVVAENEELSDNDAVRRVHEGIKARGVPTDYVVIKGITHYGIYREGFEEATRVEIAWFNQHLKPAGKDETGPRSPVASAAAPAAVPVRPTPVPDMPQSLPATAPAQPEPDAASRPRDPAAVFAWLDADSSGDVTRQELNKLRDVVPAFRENPDAVEGFFRRLDTDSDGRLTLEEYKLVRELRQRPRPAATPASPAAAPPDDTDATRSPPARSADEPAADATAAANRPTAEAASLAHFESRVRPLLVARCYGCHSADAGKREGGLALDTRAGIRAGGHSGPAVVPGDVAASLLVAAVRHEDGLEMPPDGESLSADQVADLVRWIVDGAIDPRDGVAAIADDGIDVERGREFWAFKRPVRPGLPAVAAGGWSDGEIDHFVQAARERAGLQAVADADPRTLIRRLSLDLVGLPPEPGEVQAFVTAWQHDPDAAFIAAVDRLLSSAHFGERWGRHWLDVARYAESSGKETSFSYPEAWRYRDYVIDSFNSDVPFDRFVMEQLAGDLLPAASESEKARRLVATGFLALGPKSHVERNKLQFEMDVVDEQIDAVSLTFLGLTVACARCHDHKFDPVPQRDYYALAGIFRSTETCYGTIPVIQNNNPARLLPLPESAGMPAGVPPLSVAERERLEAQVAALRAERREMSRNKQFATSEFVRNGIVLATQEARLTAFMEDGTPKLLAMGVSDRKSPKDSEFFVRGEVEKPTATVPRGFLQVLSDSTTPSITGGSGRRELAKWITSADNPLTARVFVNRVWLNLFGRGLVPTPDNFGMSGQPPSHQELLDHLAVTFMEDGWSPKRLIRRIVLSRTYRLSSTFDEAAAAKDPDNQWLWRMTPRRLDAEAIRDAMLATAGTLVLDPPTGSAVARGGEGYTAGLDRAGQLAERRFNCRAVYLPAIRGRALESLEVFDGVDGSLVTGQRDQTTVPAQSLYLLNSPAVLALASTAAERLAADADSPAARVELAYERWFGRPPTEREREVALLFIDRYAREAVAVRPRGTPELAAWTTFCQSLWASGEFLVRR